MVLQRKKKKNSVKMTPNYIMLSAVNSAVYTSSEKLPFAADGDKYKLSAIYYRE